MAAIWFRRVRVAHLSQLLASSSISGDAGKLAFLLIFSRSVCKEVDDAFIDKDAMEMHLNALSGEMVALIGKIVLTKINQNARVASLHGKASMSIPCVIVCLGKAMLLEAFYTLLTKFIGVASYPIPAHLEETLCFVAKKLLKTQNTCQNVVAAKEDEMSFQHFVGEENPQESQALGEFILYLGSHPTLANWSLTLSSEWSFKMDLSRGELVSLQHDAFVQLFKVMLKLCQFPSGSAEEMDALELDDLRAFRKGLHGVTEVFISILSLLKEQYLAHLLSLFVTTRPTADEIKKKLSTHTPELENMML
ncbi:hypothetical protein CCR75_000169 [Bremia lactucae]|uniref:Uncharacterized protein n=1 Tax=Bremia lactucae TaxID=4779 RepID=A0A976FPE3_BRELC|nr:hypothetical protein CCR75_000169 [Bremia lactucae]